MVQRLPDYSVSLSDYANQRYWPGDLKPDMRKVFQAIFRGVSVAAVDAGLALRVQNLLVSFGKHTLQMQMARNLRLADFKTEDSFILSAARFPSHGLACLWIDLFKDQLDFSFEFDSTRKAEFIRNRSPQKSEPSTCVPTAEGWGTGQAYAIVAL